MDETKEKKPPEVSGKTKTKEGDGALERLQLVSEIRRAVFLIRAQLKVIRKTAKEKVTILETAQASLLDDVDDKQLFLFELPAELPPECRAILADPSI